MKRVEIQIATGNSSDLDYWLTHPQYETRLVRRVNRYFGISTEASGSFTLTHIPTGFAAANGLPSEQQAVKLARALTSAYKRWNFTDPRRAKPMKRAKAIVYAHGGI